MARKGNGLRIAVDVTPVREGGECGGARPFVLELLRGLATAARPLQYLLLTAAHNHAAFEPFERLGMSRWLVDGDGPVALRDHGVDVLFCPMTAPTYAEPGVATVSVVYDLQHLKYPWFFSMEELGHRTRFYERVRQLADHVVCISEFSRISLIRSLGIPQIGRASCRERV